MQSIKQQMKKRFGLRSVSEHLKEFYNLAINKGVEADFRGRETIEKNLKRLKRPNDGKELLFRF